MKSIVFALLMVVSLGAFAQAPVCDQLATFPDVAVLGGTTKKCVAGCPTVRPPLCADTDGIFPMVYPKNQKAVGNYTNVVCGDINTYPVVTHEGKDFPKCVQKCQNVRPPKCVDYNSELH